MIDERFYGRTGRAIYSSVRRRPSDTGMHQRALPRRHRVGPAPTVTTLMAEQTLTRRPHLLLTTIDELLAVGPHADVLNGSPKASFDSS